MVSEGLSARVHIPVDGEVIDFAHLEPTPKPTPKPGLEQTPGFQKWITAKFAGT